MTNTIDIYTKSLILITITALALFIRITFFHTTEYNHPIRGDATYYLIYAKNIQQHNTFSKDIKNSPPIPDSFWAPGYPFFLSNILRFSSEQEAYKNILLTQSIIGALTALVTMLMGMLFLKNIWVIISGLLVAFSPHLISLGNLVLTESVFSFFLILSLYLTALSLRKQTLILLISTALCFGISYLINPVMFFNPLFIALFMYLYFSKNNKQQKYLKNPLQAIIVFLLFYFLIPSIWTLRNHLNVPPEAPSSSNRLLINAIIGTHSKYYDIYRENPRNINNPAEIDIRNINGSPSLFIDLMINRILTNPGHYANWYFIKKPILLWDWNILMGQGDAFVYPVTTSWYHKSKFALASHSIMKSLHFWLFTFALLSIFFAIKNPYNKKNYNIIILYITLFYISSVYILTQSEARYSIPLRPEMYLCAVYFISNIFSYLVKPKQLNN